MWIMNCTICRVNWILTLLIFVAFKLYRSVWHFASTTELLNVIGAGSGSILSQIILMALLGMRMPVSYYMMKYVILIAGIGCLRFAYRILRMFQERRVGLERDKRKNTMVVGGGEAGAMIIKEFQNSRYLDHKVCCVVDDNTSKVGKYIRGVKIMGTRTDILYLAHELDIDEIVVALPSVSQKEVSAILQICQKTDCQLRVLPGLYQMINGEVSVSRLRKVEIDEAAGTGAYQASGRVCHGLCPGQGGTGDRRRRFYRSELCRQIAAHAPKQLIIVDIYENNAYDIQQELKRKYPELDLVVLIASVRNVHRINTIFETYHPELVYHAAAHKHVPLTGEDSPNEAIKTTIRHQNTAWVGIVSGTV